MKNCSNCIEKKCEFGSAFENLLFCFSRSDKIIRVQTGLAVPTLVNENEEYHFIITPNDIQLLKLNLPLCSFNLINQQNISFFHEIIIDPKQLTYYVQEIFKSVKYIPPIITANPKTIKVTNIDNYLEKRRLISRHIDIDKTKAFEDHYIDIQGFYNYE